MMQTKINKVSEMYIVNQLAYSNLKSFKQVSIAPESLLKVSCILFNEGKEYFTEEGTSQEVLSEVLNTILPLLRLSSNSKKRLTRHLTQQPTTTNLSFSNIPFLPYFSFSFH